jgi:hypothetical protein
MERRKRLGRLALGGAAAVVAIAVFYILGRRGIGIPCLFRSVTGWLCPGCGNSRAALALLRLDFSGALEYNMLFPLEFAYLAWVIFRCCRSYLAGGRFTYRSKRPWIDGILLAAVLLWWPLRNLL